MPERTGRGVKSAAATKTCHRALADRGTLLRVNGTHNGNPATDAAEDRHVTALLGGLLRTDTGGGNVALSGRCGSCGYRLDSDNHKTACGGTSAGR